MPVRHSPLTLRGGFAETTFTYTPEEARAEAERCLDCDRFCSVCVGVCPNLAILTYASAADGARTCPPWSCGTVGSRSGASAPFRVEQSLQVAVLTDFCNECGNCATFCPTAGTPYRDKPRLYLDRADFEAQQDNAFMLLGHGVIEARSAGETHRVEVDGGITCVDAAGQRAPGSGHLGGAGSPRRAGRRRRRGVPASLRRGAMPCW